MAEGPLDPSMAAVHFLHRRVGRKHLKRVLDLGQQVALIFLHCQHVVGPFLDDAAGDVALAAHRVDGHHSAFQLQCVQQLGDSRDLVGFFIDPALTENQTVALGPGGNHVDDLFAALAGAAQRLAVDGYHLTGRQTGDRRNPVGKPSFHLLRVQSREHPVERVVRRNAGWKRQERLQPLLLGLPVLRHVVPTLGATQHRRNRNQQNLFQ